MEPFAEVGSGRFQRPFEQIECCTVQEAFGVNVEEVGSAAGAMQVRATEFACS